MKQISANTNKTPMPVWAEAQIAVVLEQNGYLLDDGRIARQALSCIVTPEVGDRILAAAGRDGTPYIVHILQRTNPETAQLNIPGASQMVLQQSQVTLCATEQIALRSLRDVEISAASGVLALNARNLFTTVNESLVQNVRNYIGKAEQYLLEVKQLLRLHGKQTLITAEKDVKVDGERISMG